MKKYGIFDKLLLGCSTGLLVSNLYGCGEDKKETIIIREETKYSVGGTYKGLESGETAIIKDTKNQQQITLTSAASASITFVFPRLLENGIKYDVSVTIPPETKTCAVENGSGTIASQDVMNITVTCIANE